MKYNKSTDCIRCGAKDIYDQSNALTLEGHGGYGDFIDTAFEDERRYFMLCHKCAHKLLIWLGKYSVEFASSFGSGSHSEKNYWHHGWDNLTIRGLISLIWTESRLHGPYHGFKIALKKIIQGRQEWIDQTNQWLEHITDNPKYDDSDIIKAESELTERKKWRW